MKYHQLHKIIQNFKALSGHWKNLSADQNIHYLMTLEKLNFQN